MNSFSINIISVIIGFLIGYIVIATLWLLTTLNDASWGNGWSYGYKSGLEDAKNVKIEGGEQKDYWEREETK